MQKNYEKSLFIFRRDLRLDDNKALLEACKQSEAVIPCFIFDPRQITKANTYKSNNSIQFMIESLKDLQEQLEKKGGKLYFFYGEHETVIPKIIKETKAQALFFNKDYTPFALKRDTAITHAAEKLKIAVNSYQGLLLSDPETVKNLSGKPYTVFTPFFKKVAAQKPAEPVKCHYNNFYSGTLSLAESKTILKELLPPENKLLAEHGGTSNAKKILKKLNHFKDYPETRDLPFLKTTQLSAHLKFGTVSPQQVIAAILEHKASKDLIRQLYWRDFYTHIAYHFPHVFGKAFNKHYTHLNWSKSKTHFEQWCNGMTGFPIVDAGMRQLNATGYMHNRVRMIVCSFLTKNLHINWTWGEQYFAQQLVDYDPAVNNGSWQWGASTGADAAPYFRIFNPWLQQKKFDPDCRYIKTWVPELQKVSPKLIHKADKLDEPLAADYPRPMVDHKVTSQQAKKMFQ